MPVLPAACGARSGNATSIGGVDAGDSAIAIKSSCAKRCATSGSCRAKSVGEATHQCLTQRELLERDPLVRLMRLLDVSWSTDNGGDVRVVEQSRFAAKRYLAEVM